MCTTTVPSSRSRRHRGRRVHRLPSTVTAVGHIPLAALSLIIGIDRILNEGRVFINILGNAVATIVIGKWENDFDTEQARSVLRSSSTPAQSADTDAAKVGADA
ncbi:cation:dicarboxylase symporter family transporter [Streptomyces sp. NPDC004546]|uniref:cation:dicarboxylate symporter family transporter n=1 Tax=unclassified Streptomyces TaxID=2593676 RepID=UPI0033B050C6